MISLTTNNLFKLIPGDVIRNIIELINEPNILLTYKKVSLLTPIYKALFLKIAIQRELHYTKNLDYVLNRNLPLSLDYTIRIGQRMMCARTNFRVIEIKSNQAKCIRVDIYGNKIDDKIYTMRKMRAHEWSAPMPNCSWFKCNCNWFWFICLGNCNCRLWCRCDSEDKVPIGNGLLLFNGGPEIKSVDSHYLKYKTIPINSTIDPEIDLLVTVTRTDDGFPCRPRTVYEYVITELFSNIMILSSISNPKFKLYAIKKHNEWKIMDSNYIILKIGGFDSGP